ncbi:MAG: hypothetical protein C4B59_00915 [Candidatus Methanogaster sp.]|uniref:Uncharacterized protein n=1 Tax=Candidatus Methanogaster sp. TaxID=3386292 RepID=A0AC61L706_9EURY|nr:MAG: hypothetical protein C4B59_00915 [ANME-2 cluster archaeon]
MQGMKEFLSMGGGGAGMFSLTGWIIKGAVWLMLCFSCALDTGWSRGVMGGEGGFVAAVCKAFHRERIERA